MGPSDPYYYHFLAGDLHRPCCYKCHYASEYRPADMTVGDYWGIEKEHKRFFSYKGVSLLMLNNEHAVTFFNKIEGDFYNVESTYEKVSRKIVTYVPLPSLVHKEINFMFILMNYRLRNTLNVNSIVQKY